MESEFGKRMSEVLVTIEDAMIERNVQKGVQKPNYSDEAFRAAIYIFMDTLIDKMYSLNLKESHSIKDAGAMATQAGRELSKLVHTYTGIDTKLMF